MSPACERSGTAGDATNGATAVDAAVNAVIDAGVPARTLGAGVADRAGNRRTRCVAEISSSNGGSHSGTATSRGDFRPDARSALAVAGGGVGWTVAVAAGAAAVAAGVVAVGVAGERRAVPAGVAGEASAVAISVLRCVVALIGRLQPLPRLDEVGVAADQRAVGGVPAPPGGVDVRVVGPRAEVEGRQLP